MTIPDNCKLVEPVVRGPQIDCLNELIAKVYDAAFDTSLWSPTLHEIAGALGASGAVVFGAPLGINGTRSSPGLFETMDWFFREGIAMNNPRPERAMRLRHKSPVLCESDMFSPWELEHLPYNAAVNRFYRWEMGGIFSCVDDAPLFLTVTRGHNTERFGSAEKEIMAALFPHFERAAQVALRLNLAEGNGMINAFEHTATAAVLLGNSGRTLNLNPSAELLMGPDLGVCNRRLEAKDPRSNRDLQALVHDLTLCPPQLTKRAISSAVTVRRSNGNPIVVHGLPLSEAGRERNIFQEACAVLVLVSTDDRRLPSASLLSQTYSLTGAEARLACLLSEGLDLGEAADRLQVTRHTVRSQLKSVMHKTRTNRQAELVSLLAHLAILPGNKR
ncbi:helix-turn-helix transcriptional regulator [Hyphomicrobium sulfonivorans]|uniref:helix-turn-helix transcriptional regulator n=1 Tax=Hyphomicrobium sulfonivorans TaxID=121290 RepID=UPI0012EDE1F9|nr:helix-turn-helix transcriptional regulator [Hyphomicrobium sulfonivorans]